jgi:maltodextrin utilization protein YvdJ
LKSQRDDIEKRLTLETKAFQEELNDVKVQVGNFNGYSNKKREDEYNKSIDKINKTLQQLSERMVKINA